MGQRDVIMERQGLLDVKQHVFLKMGLLVVQIHVNLFVEITK